MSSELAPFVHSISKESYLFGFEDYMTDEELAELWKESLYRFKNEVNTPFGDITSEEIIESAAVHMGLKIPPKGSELAEKIRSQAYYMMLREQEERMNQNRDPDFINEDLVPSEQSQKIMNKLYQEVLAERKHL